MWGKGWNRISVQENEFDNLAPEFATKLSVLFFVFVAATALTHFMQNVGTATRLKLTAVSLDPSA